MKLKYKLKQLKRGGIEQAWRSSKANHYGLYISVAMVVVVAVIALVVATTTIILVMVSGRSSSNNRCSFHIHVLNSGLGVLHALFHLFLTKSEVSTIINLHFTVEVY